MLPNIDLQQPLEDISAKLGAWTYVLVGLAAFLETGAFVGLVLPGETVVILGGAVAGQGETSIVLTIGIVWFWRLGGRHDQLPARPPARPRVRAPPRPEGADHPRALRAGRGLLRPPRRQDDPDRPLHRPGPGAGAVHRRQLGDALPAFLPFSVLGTGLWAAAFVLIGYFASQSLDAAAETAGRGALCSGSRSA